MKNVIPTELPEWRTHEVVRAAKIVRVDESIPCLIVNVDGEERGLLPRTEEFWKRREPFRGLAAPDPGYYVLNGSVETWEPTHAFEHRFLPAATEERG